MPVSRWGWSSTKWTSKRITRWNWKSIRPISTGMILWNRLSCNTWISIRESWFKSVCKRRVPQLLPIYLRKQWILQIRLGPLILLIWRTPYCQYLFQATNQPIRKMAVWLVCLIFMSSLSAAPRSCFHWPRSWSKRRDSADLMKWRKRVQTSSKSSNSKIAWSRIGRVLAQKADMESSNPWSLRIKESNPRISSLRRKLAKPWRKWR